MDQQQFAIYVPVARAGLGHCLTCITAYANYSYLTSRKFFVDVKRWTSFLIDHESDVDPFFSTYFDGNSLKGKGIDLSKKNVKSIFEQAGKEKWETLVLIDKSTDIEQFKKSALSKDIKGDVSFMRFPTFRRKFFLKRRNHPAKLLVFMVNEPTKGGKKMKKVKDFKRIADFNAEFIYPDLNDINLEKCVGIHLRHGNGEYLHGRLEGEDAKFERYVDRVVKKAQKLAKKENLDVIAFSDSNGLLETLRGKYGILTLADQNLPDKAWFDHMTSRDKDDKSEVITKVMQDFFAVANCKHVVCGVSLFTMAAYFFSKNRSFHMVKPRRGIFRFL